MEAGKEGPEPLLATAARMMGEVVAGWEPGDCRSSPPGPPVRQPTVYHKLNVSQWCALVAKKGQ